MFWQNNPCVSSHLTTLLDKENVTLTEVLDNEEVIQECKNLNGKLIAFLSQPEILSELIDLIISEPTKSEDVEDSERFKLPYRASEIMTCEVQALCEKICADENLLGKLYSFLEVKETPGGGGGGGDRDPAAIMAAPALNPLQASFFSKAFGVLFTRKQKQNWFSYQYTCVQVIDFLKKKPLVKDLLRHIGTSAISDIILRLISCVEGTTIKQSLFEWLDENRLIESIIEMLDDRNDRDTHDNASRLLIEILRVSRDNSYNEPNEKFADPLLATLEAPETVDLLLNVMFRSRDERKKAELSDDPAEKDEESSRVLNSESTLINGISILLAFLEARKQQAMESAANHQSAGYSASSYNAGSGDFDGLSPEEIERQQKILSWTIASIVPRIQDLTDLLTDPPARPAIATTAGVLDPPLGATRLNVAKLVNALLATHFPDVNEKFIQCKTVDILLDLFFKYSLNNFLHAQVEQCMSHILAFKPLSAAPAEQNRAPAPPPSSDEDKVPLGTSMETQAEKNPDESLDDSNSPTPPASSPSKEAEKVEEVPATEEEKGEETAATPASPPAAASSPVKNEGGEEHADKDNTAADSTEKKDETEMDTTSPLEEGSLEDSMEQAKSKGYENPMLVHILQDCDLIGKIMSAWEENEEQDATETVTKQRKGYMGHLTRIANTMVDHAEKAYCQQLIEDQLCNLPNGTSTEDWDVFVKGKLASTNSRNTLVPVESYSQNVGMSSSEDDDAEFRDLHYSQDNALQQVFSDYQMQQMSEHFIDSFGFGNDEFNNDEDQSPLTNVQRLNNITFGLDDNGEHGDDSGHGGPARSSADIFEEVCNQRAGTLPALSAEEIDDQEDLWEERTREIQFSNASKPQAGDLPPSGKQPASDSSSSSEDDDDDDDTAGSGMDARAKKNRKRKSNEHQMEVDQSPSPSVPASEASPCKSSQGVDANTDGESDAAVNSTAHEAPSDAEVTGGAVAPVAMDTGNPWDSAAKSDKETDSAEASSQESKAKTSSEAGAPPDDGGWANFDSI